MQFQKSVFAGVVAAALLIAQSSMAIQKACKGGTAPASSCRMVRGFISASISGPRVETGDQEIRLEGDHDFPEEWYDFFFKEATYGALVADMEVCLSRDEDQPITGEVWHFGCVESMRNVIKVPDASRKALCDLAKWGCAAK